MKKAGDSWRTKSAIVLMLGLGICALSLPAHAQETPPANTPATTNAPGPATSGTTSGGNATDPNGSVTGERFCNHTSYVLYTALAYPGSKELVSEGWIRLRPGQCRTVLRGPVPKGEYYVYAHSSPAHRGGEREWSGPTALCVGKKTFSVGALANCEAQGLESANFHIIDGNPPLGRETVFTETGEYGKRAEQAGLQRLLQDNGLNIRSIDGYAGAGTRNAIRQYLRQQHMTNMPNTADLIDRLESTADATKKKTGMEVCNRTKHHVWTALARREGKVWDSRGWWDLAPNSCMQLVDEMLSTREKLYLYAGMSTPEGEFPLKDASETFCVGSVRFSVPDRHDCKVRGYQEARFAKVDIARKGITTVELHAGDFGNKPITSEYAEQP